MGYLTSMKALIEHYEHIRYHGHKNRPKWRGKEVDKFPQDLVLYAQLIFKRKPDFIIETGTAYGGSALFFGDMLLLSGGSRVFSVDVNARNSPPHPFVTYIKGSSVDEEILKHLRNETKDGSVMATFDSDHSKEHVLKELNAYADIVSSGQYIVVEDCYTGPSAKESAKGRPEYHPYFAVEEFLKANGRFRKIDVEKQFIFAATKGGWLRKR